MCRKIMRQSGSSSRATLSPFLRGFVGECVGTFLFTTIGFASIAQVVLCDHTLKKQHGNFTSISIAWGVGFCFGVMFAKRNSNAHLNPAVSIASCVTGSLPWRQLPVYVAGQMLGGFLASLVVFGIYFQAIEFYAINRFAVTLSNHTEADLERSICMSISGVFTTFPQSHLATASYQAINITCFFDQFFSTALLMAFASAITDTKVMKIPESGQAPLLGAMITCMLSTFAANCGASLNPARDLAPRVMLFIFSRFGSCVFTAGAYYFWIPLIACPLGAIVGAIFYKLTVSNHLPNNEERNNHDFASIRNKDTESLLDISK